MAELVSKREAYAGLIEADQASTVRTTVGAGADMSKPWNPYVSVSDGLQYSRKYSLSEVAEMRNMVSDHYSKPDEVATLMQQKAYSVQDLALATRQTINQVQSFLAQANWMHSNIAASSAPVSTTPTTPVNALQTPGDPAVPNSPPAKVKEPESAATQSQAILATPYEIDKNENAAVVVQDPVKPISDVVVSQIQDLWKNRAKPEVVSDFMNLHGLMLEDLARVTDLSTAQLQEMWLTNRS